MTVQQIFDAILGNLGTLVVFIVIIAAGQRKIWVFGWYAKELKDRNEALERKLDRALGVGENVTSLARETTDKLEKQATAGV